MSTLRVLLFLSAPLWGPLALLYHLARICGDGLLFVFEGYGVALEVRPWPLRPLFYLLAVPLFPVVITLETAFSAVLFLGGLPLRALNRAGEGPTWPKLPIGLAVLALSPAWAPLVVLVWVARRLVWDLGVTPLARRIEGASARSASRGRFETFVALRYLRGRKATAGVSVVTALTIFGVMMGVWCLVVVLSVMEGFEVDLQDKILGANADIVVLGPDGRLEDWALTAARVREVDGVQGVTPFLYAEYVLRSGQGYYGAILEGVDPASLGEVRGLVGELVLGPQGEITSASEAQALLEHLDDTAAEASRDAMGAERDLPGLVIGQQMQEVLHVKVGDVIQAVSPQPEVGPLGTLSARFQEFRVAGVFRSGLYEHDAKFSYVGLVSAQRFLRMGDAVTGLEVAVDDVYGAPRIAAGIRETLAATFTVRAWQELNAQFFAALKLEKMVMGVILSFIVAVAALNIASMLIMLVLEKRREIAILKAMGAGRFDLTRLFMVQGLLVGFIGTVLGLGAGLATCAALARWHIVGLDHEVYYLDTLPVHVSVGLLAVTAVVAVGISFLATLFPSWEGGSLDPVEGLRDA
jgi:lipoprotein-releasing system permease protein